MILIRTITLLLLIGCTLSCTRRERPKPPEHILSEEKMTAVLYDVQVVEAIYQRGGKPSAEAGLEMGRQLYGEVFEKHDITREQFKESFSWYSQKPRLMDDMYEKIIERLNTEQAKLNEKQESEKERSINGLNEPE